MRPALPLALALLLSGCAVNIHAGDGIGGGTSPPAPAVGLGASLEVQLNVTSVQVTPGRCFDGATAFREECHTVRLRFTNPGNETVQARLSWSARDPDGGGAHDGMQDGLDSVAPGTTEPMTVRFTLKQGAPHLTRILFEGFPNARGEAALPAY